MILYQLIHRLIFVEAKLLNVTNMVENLVRCDAYDGRIQKGRCELTKLNMTASHRETDKEIIGLLLKLRISGKIILDVVNYSFVGEHSNALKNTDEKYHQTVLHKGH